MAMLQYARNTHCARQRNYIVSRSRLINLARNAGRVRNNRSFPFLRASISARALAGSGRSASRCPGCHAMVREMKDIAGRRRRDAEYGTLELRDTQAL